MSAHTARLDFGWYWKERDSSVRDVADEFKPYRRHEWTAVSGSLPTEIHVELLTAQKIPHPQIGFNEHEVQWVGEREWLFATEFAYTPNDRPYAQLVFEGLDTICEIWLNGLRVAKSDNMFAPHYVDVDVETLQPLNSLLLHFYSAKLYAQDLERQFGRVRAGSCNLGDPSRVYVRKAQYDWRWDWGPELMTAGPWRPIVFKEFTTILSSVQTKALVTADNEIRLSLNIDLAGSISSDLSLGIRLLDQNGECLRDEVHPLSLKEFHYDNVVSWAFPPGSVKLWWPVGYGDPHLYRVEVTVSDNANGILDRVSKIIGFRRVELVQKPLEESDKYGKGSTFFFEVNGVRIFVGGSNWVPCDNFLTSVTSERYRKWLELLKNGNQNMVRLWGGGVYEPDIFYDICDELGILVWQDFQFSCGIYPAHEEFVESVRVEAVENVKRLRHHPSLVLFCGNNEDYQQVLQWGGIDELPARIIYEDVLPEIVSRFTSPAVPYWRGSPYGGKGWDTADPTIGDVHQWNIWAGSHQLYQDYDIMGGRFVRWEGTTWYYGIDSNTRLSEFGIPSFPDWETIKYWMGDVGEKHWHPQSKVVIQHDKAGSHERRFSILMNENFRITGDFERYVFLTRLMQSEGVGYAYRSWRREWRGEGREFCGGILVWQLNDCWPGISWSIADYFLRPKPVYYTIARELRSVSVGILRLVEKNRETDRPRQFYEFGAFQSVKATIQVWITNAKLQPLKAILHLGFYDLETDKQHTKNYPIVLEPNQTTEALSIPILDPDTGEPMDISQPARSHSVIVWARVLDGNSKEVLARFSDWPQPYKILDFPDPGLNITRDGEDTLWIQVERPVKGLWLNSETEEPEAIAWSDNNLDLIPGDKVEIRALGLKTQTLKVAYLGKENGIIWRG